MIKRMKSENALSTSSMQSLTLDDLVTYFMLPAYFKQCAQSSEALLYHFFKQ